MGTQQFCLRWNNHQTNMLTVFDQLLSNEALVDVTLACEGLNLKAHKIILSACSPFFQNLFLENPCKHPIVIMKDIKYTDLKAIIDFMYRGEVNVSQDQLSALLNTAEILKVKGLEVSGDSRQTEQNRNMQQDVHQHLVNTPQSVPSSNIQTQQRTKSPLLNRKKRGRLRKRSLSGSNSSNSEDRVVSEIKLSDSSAEIIEDVTSEVELNNDSCQQPVTSSYSQPQISSHSTQHNIPPLDSHTFLSSLVHQKDSVGIEEPLRKRGNYDDEPAKLMEQSMITENVPIFTDSPSQSSVPSSSTQLAIPTTRLPDIQSHHSGPGSCDSQPLIPCSISSEPIISSCVLQDSNQDIKPTLISFQEPPISPVVGPSYQDSSNSMMYTDTLGVSAVPGPSGYQMDKQPSESLQQQQSHENLRKSEEKFFVCKNCQEDFSTQQELTWHLKLYHGVEGKHQCDICCRHFTTKENLCTHKKKHKEISGIFCHICSKKFIRAISLQKHVMTKH